MYTISQCELSVSSGSSRQLFPVRLAFPLSAGRGRLALTDIALDGLGSATTSVSTRGDRRLTLNDTTMADPSRVPSPPALRVGISYIRMPPYIVDRPPTHSLPIMAGGMVGRRTHGHQPNAYRKP